ncbi:hypothetical protein GCM10010267_16240 [Streptomyces griseorubens]|nr:hypothetical protein GCM10010267_16240 [Streptomyces griseorubens]
MRGFAEGEDAGAGRQQFHDGRRFDRAGEVLDAGFHALNGIVELTVKGLAAVWSGAWVGTFKRVGS